MIGTDAPVQYEQRDDIGEPRKRLPDRHDVGREPPTRGPLRLTDLPS